MSETSAHATCRACGFPRALSVRMAPRKGEEPVTMTSCPRCEHRSWTDSTGSPIEAPALLKRMSGRTDFDLRPAPTSGRRRGSPTA